MENKEEIVKRLKLLLMVTRIGDNIADLILSEGQDKVTILFKMGGCRRWILKETLVMQLSKMYWAACRRRD